ncbi:MAG: T9SS type A sorting domain-containing protein, partial [Bacteroidaceae bacterium]|nr:T9SS type A sorting domain-containing protein [Bacteroidaceae bacterium]
MAVSVDGDSATTVHTMSDLVIQHFQKPHYGLVATELREVMPELVYEGQDGELCINYIEMIPLLVESIKELKAEIAALQGGNNGGAIVMSRAISGATDIEESTALTIPMLKQNNPNPFTENTVIEYALPETVQTANLYIYDMNGKQIEQIALTERGESSVTVNGGQLAAGMYLYSLIADGKVIDTKRMILTK